METHPLYRVHVIGLAHLPTRREYSSCAYSAKILKMCKMLKSLGHSVIFYGAEGSEVECDEFVQVVSKEVLTETYGEYDFTKEFYKRDWADLAHATFNKNAVREINLRKKDDDFLFISMGVDQKPIVDGTKMLLTVESGVGYHGILTPHKVFESYAWMHYLYGKYNFVDGNWFDCVIPNFFDLEDFQYGEGKGGYMLFMGRLIRRKGVQLAQEVCKKLNKRLIIAGQIGDEGTFNESLWGEFVGHADIEKRKELMAGAEAMFCATSYVEPFGGVAVEGMLCGTPIISTDWGAFTETNLSGVTGYRVRSFGEALWAAENASKLDRKKIRKWAEDNYSLETVGKMYQAYMEQLYALHSKEDWYTENHRGLSEYNRYSKVWPS